MGSLVTLSSATDTNQQSAPHADELIAVWLAAERELTVAWGWVLVGTALSQVIGAPIAAGGWTKT